MVDLVVFRFYRILDFFGGVFLNNVWRWVCRIVIGLEI